MNTLLTSGRFSRPSRWSLAALLMCGAVIGLISNVLHADEEECEEITSVEGPGAQDTNHDGIATIAEGMVDLDDDDLFGDAEAEFYGMNCYICWEQFTECGAIPVSGGYVLRPNRMCVYNWRTGASWCKVYNYQYCKDYGTHCKVGP